MNIYQKLVEVRKEVPYLKKEAQGHQFKYNPSSQVLSAVREKMDELGLLLIPRVLGHTLHEKTATNAKEHLTELDMEFTWVNAEKPDETITVPWYGQGLDTGEKGVGKALTYAEKFFLLKFFNIATDKDDPDSQQGGRNDEPQSKPTTQPPKTNGKPASEPTLNLITKLINELAKARGAQAAVVYEKLKESMGTLVEQENWTQSLASQAIDVLNEWKKKQGAA